MRIELIICLIIMLFGICCSYSGRKPGNLGISDGKFASCPNSPNCVSSFASDAEHAVAPFGYSGSTDEAYLRLRKVLSEMKRIVIITEKENYIHAEVKSFIFRFVDDIEFYFPAAEKVIHVRSASRKGYSDLGVNRKRVEEIRKKFSNQ